LFLALPSLLNFNTDRYIRKAQECEIQALRNLIDNLKAVNMNYCTACRINKNIFI